MKVSFISYPAILLFWLLLPVTAPGGSGFPDFITNNEDYYVTRIGGVPKVDGGEYRLEVTGMVSSPRTFTLEELQGLPLREFPLTVECIGNSPGGPLLSTAVWRGFLLYDLLQSLGLMEGATGVRYEAVDGYYASHTLDQVRDNGVVGALYMNGVPLPPVHGFPLRILNPGYYGVKQPAWVVKIEVIGRPVKDYWEDRGWDCSPPMAVDSKIFLPGERAELRAGETLEIGGAAFGGTRIRRVEFTLDRGASWREAEIFRFMEADHVWVFWRGTVKFPDSGAYQLNVRATDIHGNAQEEDDPEKYDGTNDWPVLKIRVK